MLSEKIISVLVFAGTFTIWTLFLGEMYENWLVSQGSTMGQAAETFGGGILIAGLAMFISYVLVRQIRRGNET